MEAHDFFSIVRPDIEKANAQDVEAAKALIKEFCATVNQNRQLNPDGTYRRNSEGERIPHNKPSGIHTQFNEELLDYFVNCFEKIGDFVGESGMQKQVTADVALNLSSFGKRGAKSSPKTREDSLLRGLRVWKEHKKSNCSIETICAHMAIKAHQSAHTLERDYKLFISVVASASREIKGM